MKTVPLRKLILISWLCIVAVGVVVFWRPLRFIVRRKIAPQLITLEVQLEVGDRLLKPDGQVWRSASPRSLIIASSHNCAACEMNHNFEDYLALRATAAKVPVFYTVSDDSRQDEYARQLTAKSKAVIRCNLSALGIGRTPTVLAFDDSGKVMAIRVGSVPSADQSLVAEELFSGVSAPLYQRINENQFKGHLHASKLSAVIALREHHIPPTSSNVNYRYIPTDELEIRAPREIQQDADVFVDCRTARGPRQCQNALLILAKTRQANRLYAVELPRRGSQ